MPRAKKSASTLPAKYTANSLLSNGLRYCEIPLKDLQLDPAYQTPNRQRRNANLMGNFDIRKANTLLTSWRNGTLYCIDGGHRSKAAQAAGKDKMVAIVLEGLSQTDEAILFATQHIHTNNISPIEAFDAEVTGNVSETLVIENLCKTLGYSIAHYGKVGHTYIAAINAVKRIFQKNGIECLEWVLTYIRDLTWYDKPGCVDNSILRSFESVWAIHEEAGTLDVAEKRLFDAFHRLSPKYVSAFVKAYMPTDDKRTATKSVFQLIAAGKMTAEDMMAFLPENQVA